ncbi:alcohol dehydrogenase [Desulfobacterota bacterium AH_259_B03_O07]|nr:alcohol dehydrogenase [Desulfobacterota bacterium AH_259_B03_O07]
MKAAVTYGTKDVRVEDVADPKIENPTDAIVKVTAGGICGSDLHIYWGHFQLKEGEGVGHEFVGRMEEVGKDVKSLKKGDKVIAPFWVSCGNCYFCKKGLTTSCLYGGCFGFGHLLGGLPGCQAEYVRVPFADGTLVKVPDSLADDSNDEKTLFLGDNICTGYHGALCGGIQPGEVVVVIGDGAVGLFATYSATLFGPSKVITVGHHDYRLDIAKKYGSDITVNSLNDDPSEKIKEVTDGRGADVVIECVGNSDSLLACLQYSRPGGTVSITGLFFEPIPINMTDFFLRNLTLRGGVAPSRTYIPRLMPLVENGKLDPTLVISHRIPLSETPKGYDLMDQRKEGAIKVVLNP